MEEFLAMPEQDGVKAELVEGEVIAVGRGGARHEKVKATVTKLLWRYMIGNPIGEVFAESMYRINDSELIPDVSVVLAPRSDTASDAMLTGAPDIAIEVVSSEPASHLERKIALYLASGASAVWVAYPESKVIWIYDRDGARSYSGSAAVTSPILPGFSAEAASFFAGL